MNVGLSYGQLRSLVVAAMENNHDHHHHEADQKVETLDLLEESWFYKNLFNRRRRMLRCYSDPCSSTSSNFSQEVLAKDISSNQTSKPTNKSQDKGSAHSSLIPEVQARNNNGGRSKLNGQLSLQASRSTKKKHEIQEEAIKTDRKSKLSEESWRSNLLRTPSLPTSVGVEELIQDDDSDIRMSKLIRQALANPADILPPRHSPNKAMTRSCSMLRSRPPRNLEMETNNNTNMIQEMRRRYSNQKMLQKSHSDLAFQELQGFKDLGFTFDKEDLSPNVVNILPGLQENAIDKVIRRPYLSEAWVVQSRATPIPNCVSKNSAQDMKAQLKFWARAVATNVRQKC